MIPIVIASGSLISIKLRFNIRQLSLLDWKFISGVFIIPPPPIVVISGAGTSNVIPKAKALRAYRFPGSCFAGKAAVAVNGTNRHTATRSRVVNLSSLPREKTKQPRA